MSSDFNLASLPVPNVIEPIDYEEILSAKVKKFKELEPEWDSTLESDPALKLLQVAAYEEMIERQRVNDAAKSVMLPWAIDKDLDNLAALYKLKRLIVQEETDNSPAIFESNESLRERCLLAWNGISTAGPRKAYIFHARSASSNVKDANAYRIKGGQIAVIVLAHSVDGTANDEVLALVSARVNDDEVRPLCCEAIVKTAKIHEYKLNITLEIADEIAYANVIGEAEKRAWEYVNFQHRIGGFVSESALKAALHVFGVQDVNLNGFTSIRTDKDTAPFCYGIRVNSLKHLSVC